MSSTYSVDFSSAYRLGDTASIKNSGDPVRSANNWVNEVQSRSGNASVSTPPSPCGSTTDIDLDLDSLFKRLDKYTTEMEEVEARLKRNRSASDDSHHINIKRFSFEINQPCSDGVVLRGASVGSPKIGPSPASSVLVSTTEDPEKDDGSEKNGDILVEEMEDLEESLLIIQSNALPHHEPKALLATLEQPFGDKGLVDSNRVSLESGLDLHIPIQSNAREGSKGLLAEPLQVKPSSELEEQRLIPGPDSLPPNPKQLLSSQCLQETKVDHEHDQKDPQEMQDNGQENSFEELEYSDIDEPGPAVPIAWAFPPRTSSKTFPLEEKSEQTAEISPKPLQRRMTAENRQSVRHGGFWSAPSLLLLDQEPVPPLPAVPQSGSVAIISSSPPLAPLSLCSPREDQIRRELESFALHEGPEILELKYKKRRPPKLDLVDFDGEILEAEEERGSRQEPGMKEQITDELGRPRPRRSKSILSIFQRKSPLEKVIDLYLDDQPEEKPPRPLSRWTTMSRKGSPTSASMPKSPRVPPMPANSPGIKQTSIG